MDHQTLRTHIQALELLAADVSEDLCVFVVYEAHGTPARRRLPLPPRAPRLAIESIVASQYLPSNPHDAHAQAALILYTYEAALAVPELAAHLLGPVAPPPPPQARPKDRMRAVRRRDTKEP